MVDLTFLKKFAKDDPDKIKRYISLYLELAPKAFEDMQRNIKNEEWDQLRIHAHSLKPQADFMGILNLKEELNNIEEAVKLNNFDEIENLFNAALQISTDSTHSLKEALNHL